MLNLHTSNTKTLSLKLKISFNVHKLVSKKLNLFLKNKSVKLIDLYTMPNLLSHFPLNKHGNNSQPSFRSKLRSKLFLLSRKISY